MWSCRKLLKRLADYPWGSWEGSCTAWLTNMEIVQAHPTTPLYSLVYARVKFIS